MTALPPPDAPATGKRDGMARWWRDLANSPRHANAWRTLKRYLGFTTAANLTWETVQLPLYTLWNEANAGDIVFAVAHCTGGDVLIALSALIVTILLCRSHRWPEHDYRRVAFIATLIGVSYTVFSEWHNTVVAYSWTYSEWMPVLPITGTGLAPLAQWLLLPPLAFWWAGRCRQSTHSEEVG